MFKKIIKSKFPTFGFRLIHKAGLYKNFVPRVGSVAYGDFDRLQPFDNGFGYERGGPIDRYYIENFLANESSCIAGRVLEIGDNEYTLRYGQKAVTQSDILHVNESNEKATFIGDLTNAPHLPDNTFDCIILTQTLHLIYDYKLALKTCYRILRSGGKLLITSPGITPIDKGEWKDTWYWSFTDKALQKLLRETFNPEDIEIKTFGNVFTAASFLYGMGLHEVPKDKLDYTDPQFQVIITVKATKT